MPLTLARLLAALTLSIPLFVACSGGGSPSGDDRPDDPPATGAAVTGSTQDRTFDPEGHTLNVTFERAVVAADAERTAYYSITGANVVSAALIAPDTVRLVADRVVVPGDRSLDVAPGIRDAEGEVSPGVSARRIDSTDIAEPDASRIAGVTVAGVNNDEIVVIFDDRMVRSEVERAAFWTVESPIGTPVDLSGATVAYDASLQTATLTLSGGQNLGTANEVAAVFSNMRDIGGNVIRRTAFGVSAIASVVVGDATPPTLVSASMGESAGTLRLVFSEPVQFVRSNDLVTSTSSVGTRLAFTEASNPGVLIHASASALSVDGFGADATFATAPEVGDTVSVFGVADLAGNVIEPVTSAVVVARDPSAPGISIGSTTLTAIEGENNDLFEIQFDGPLHPDGLFLDTSYGLLFDFFADTRGACGSWNGTDTVTFLLEGETDHEVQRAGTYILAVANQRSAQGVLLDTVSQESAISATGDAAAATIDRATLDGTSEVLVTFSEATDESRVLDTAGYVLAGRTTSAVEPLGPRVARVTFDAPVSVGETLEVTGRARTDRAGNQGGSSAMVAVTAEDVAAPSIASVTASTESGVDNDQIVVTFSEQVSPAEAVDAARYEITHDGASLGLGGATLRYASVGPTVTMTLVGGQNLTHGAPLSVSATGIRDAAGNTVSAAAAAATVGGDGDAPLTLAAFVNRRAASDGSVVEITADEALTTEAGLAVNWSASGGRSILSVQRVSPVRFRVTLDGALGLADTLSLAGAADLAGNTAVGSLAVDPIE